MGGLSHTPLTKQGAEVYAVSFPGLGRKQQISREGGVVPRWSATGRELFFLSRGRMMVARPLDSDATSWQNPTPLFDLSTRFDFALDFAPAYNGRTFYVIAPNPDAPAREIHVVQNWFEEVKRLVPTK
jgi:hypothetical protein